MDSPSRTRSSRWTKPQVTITACFVLASVLLFCISLTQETYAFQTRTRVGQSKGIYDLLLGWFDLSETPAWLANPVLLFTWIIMLFQFGRYVGLATGIAAMCLCLDFCRTESVTIFDSQDTHAIITGLGLGYWLWVASSASALAGCAICVLLDLTPASHSNNIPA